MWGFPIHPTRLHMGSIDYFDKIYVMGSVRMISTWAYDLALTCLIQYGIFGIGIGYLGLKTDGNDQHMGLKMG